MGEAGYWERVRKILGPAGFKQKEARVASLRKEAEEKGWERCHQPYVFETLQSHSLPHLNIGQGHGFCDFYAPLWAIHVALFVEYSIPDSGRRGVLHSHGAGRRLSRAIKRDAAFRARIETVARLGGEAATVALLSQYEEVREKKRRRK